MHIPCCRQPRREPSLTWTGCMFVEAQPKLVTMIVTAETHKSELQAAKEAAQAEADRLRAEVDRVVARQQDRVADWEAAVAEEEAELASRRSHLEVGHFRLLPHCMLQTTEIVHNGKTYYHSAATWR